MSRYYNMSVKIEDYDPTRRKEIIAACVEEWGFMEDDFTGAAHEPLTASAENSLCAGESEYEFTERLTQAIWTANEAYCAVEVQATYLEELPSDIYTLDEDDFEEWTRSRESQPAGHAQAG